MVILLDRETPSHKAETPPIGNYVKLASHVYSPYTEIENSLV